MAANKVKVTIMGADYSILAEDDPRYVQLLGKELDSKMAGIIKATVTADRLREQIKDYLDDASAAKSKADLARHDSERLKKEVEALQAENERLRRELDAVLSLENK